MRDLACLSVAAGWCGCIAVGDLSRWHTEYSLQRSNTHNRPFTLARDCKRSPCKVLWLLNDQTCAPGNHCICQHSRAISYTN